MEKIIAEELMTENLFWTIISNSRKEGKDIDSQARSLKLELKKLSEQELFGFLYHYYKLSSKSYNGDLWLVPYILLGGCSDDWFDYFRDWLISRGKAVYYSALENPDSICDEFDLISEGDEPTFGGLGYVYREVFEEKFKKDFYKEEDKYDYGDALNRDEIEFKWSREDEESMRKICPKTFDKWWNNDRF
ncbi:DUF4240 domain-containing protein [Flagellimonas hymeniacidonis]|uniref:DUF4240 domain-containing protein n=1 Tax=Flagellimonas hymeniacidonis TaxID=2603628 RepID=A0A5C8V7V1_9FLAO|nr:DUF4240 domain-containing protein [Flagellimonas hymeniacidonis]TXN37801.1 DUF4240 domain-containing protein [Flagellimonas hymeniacidonis]